MGNYSYYTYPKPDYSSSAQDTVPLGTPKVKETKEDARGKVRKRKERKFKFLCETMLKI